MEAKEREGEGVERDGKGSQPPPFKFLDPPVHIRKIGLVCHFLHPLTLRPYPLVINRC